jgi:hypothetical protein
VKKRQYIKPEVNKIDIDYTISIQMATPIHPPDDRGGGAPGNSKNTPFQSPFGDKPFG